jgi:hypothetical protein
MGVTGPTPVITTRLLFGSLLKSMVCFYHIFLFLSIDFLFAKMEADCPLDQVHLVPPTRVILK